MTYSVLAELASQREEQLVARARLARPDAIGTTTTTRRTGKRDRARAARRLRSLVPWA
jgi:hypothetical protein